MSLPVVTLRGSPREQGICHGRELSEEIGRNLKIYFARFEAEGKLSRSEALERATRYAGVIEATNPDYYAAMVGVAEGSGSDLDEIVALNVRYEIFYHQLSALSRGDGCTAFAISPEVSANGHLLVGQNWDWIPDVQGAVVRTIGPGAPDTLSFTEAGVVGGKIGLNSEGLALAINGLHTTADDWSRLRKPFHVRCHEILRSSDLDRAVRIVTDEPRSCSTNFLIARRPDDAVDVEAAPDVHRLLEWRSGRLVHTNHFVDPAALGVVEPEIERLPSSHERLDRFGARLRDRESVSVDDLQELLCDHEAQPYSICRHLDLSAPPEERYVTVASVIMDLETRTMRVTDGPPCGTRYDEVMLAPASLT